MAVTLLDLPTEILIQICEEFCIHCRLEYNKSISGPFMHVYASNDQASLLSLSLTCSTLYDVANPVLYHWPVLDMTRNGMVDETRESDRQQRLMQRLINDEGLVRYVKRACISTQEYSTDWKYTPGTIWNYRRRAVPGRLGGSVGLNILVGPNMLDSSSIIFAMVIETIVDLFVHLPVFKVLAYDNFSRLKRLTVLGEKRFIPQIATKFRQIAPTLAFAPSLQVLHCEDIEIDQGIQIPSNTIKELYLKYVTVMTRQTPQLLEHGLPHLRILEVSGYLFPWECREANLPHSWCWHATHVSSTLAHFKLDLQTPLNSLEAAVAVKSLTCLQTLEICGPWLPEADMNFEEGLNEEGGYDASMMHYVGFLPTSLRAFRFIRSKTMPYGTHMLHLADRVGESLPHLEMVCFGDAKVGDVKTLEVYNKFAGNGVGRAPFSVPLRLMF